MALVRKFLRALKKIFKIRSRRSHRSISRRKRKSHSVVSRKNSRQKKTTRKNMASRPKPPKLSRQERPRLKKKGLSPPSKMGRAVEPKRAGPPPRVPAKSAKIAKIPPAHPPAVAEPPGIPVGEITHYFSKIMVCVVKITGANMMVGDKIQIKGATTDFSQKVASLQIESVDVRLARRGDLVGLKVQQACRVGDQVLKGR